jgi:hypothetical protein
MDICVLKVSDIEWTPTILITNNVVTFMKPWSDVH